MSLSRNFILLIINFVSLAFLCIAVLIYALSDENSTRVRNSFLVDPATVEELQYAPLKTPSSFITETLPPPEYLTAAIETLFNQRQSEALSPFEKAKIISAHLIENKTKGKPIQSNTKRAYEIIRDKGRGYCADYSQVFVALALAAGLEVREWGLGFDDFGSGHAFNEVFEPSLNKWVFVDAYHSLYAVDRSSEEPLSVLEFQHRLLNDTGKQSFVILPIVETRFRFSSQQKAVDYYQRGASHFYLFWGNNVFSYDGGIGMKWFGDISRSVEVLVSILSGSHPKIRVLLNEQNKDNVSALHFLNYTLIAAAIAGMCLFLSLLVLASKILGKSN